MSSSASSSAAPGTARPHRARQAGPKFAKKKSRDHAKKQVKHVHKNPRAFAFKSSQRASRSQRRNLDIGVKKQHLPISTHIGAAPSLTADKTSTVEPPPFLVVVVGPPKTGKSSIISSLVKHYTGHNIPIASIKGPITILTSPSRRITLIECPPSLHSMIDLAKTADLVLLTVDASFGFEMETFEFLNILKQHGFPRVMGVLTHLDHFRTTKQLNAVKKKMKHRFWTEICDGAKLFYLSGLIHHKYPKREIMNLARFISVMKFRPIIWRSQHPYLLADRMEDLTDPHEIQTSPLCDRRIALYGYVRGTLMHPNAPFHFLGVGDFTAASFTVLDDPVPVKQKGGNKAAGESKVRKKLNEKEKRLYAPMSDVGDVIYDDDVVYIQMKDKHVHYSKEEMLVREEAAAEGEEGANTKGETPEQRAERQRLEMSDAESGEGVRMVRHLQDVSMTVDEKMKHSGLQLFKGSTLITAQDMLDAGIEEANHADNDAADEDEDEDEEMSQLRAEEASEARQQKEERISSRAIVDSTGRLRRKVVFDGEEDSAIQQQTDTDEDEEEDEQQGVEEEEDQDEDDDYYQDTSAISLTAKQQASALSEQKDVDEDEEEVDEAEEEDEADEEGEEERDEEDEQDEEGGDESGAEQERESMFAHPESEEKHQSDAEQSGLQWKESLVDRAASRFQKSLNLMELVYGADAEERNNQQRKKEQQQELKQNRQKNGSNKLSLLEGSDEDEDEAGSFDDGEEFFKRAVRDVTIDDVDSVKLRLLQEADRTEKKDWTDPAVYESIRNKFVTGDWSAEQHGTGEADGEEKDSEEEEEADKKKHRKARKGRRNQQQSNDKQNKGEMEDEDEDDGITVTGTDDLLFGETEEAAAERRRKAKEALKQSFNTDYDAGKRTTSATTGEGEEDGEAATAEGEEKEDDEHYQQLHSTAAAQSTLNATAFAGVDVATRLQLEGARPGSYVRIEMTGVSCEFIQHYSPLHPLILGGLLHHESNVGYITMRFKRHRWHRKILKSHDPLIFSIGWRRFQSCPVYALEDLNHRLRYLKYTPEHMHCIAVTYAPFIPQNNGIIAYQYTDNYSAFRIAATGVIIDMSSTSANSLTNTATNTDNAIQPIVKKLKLIGHPYKIFKHTAYIRDMFNSSLEVNKFIGAKIVTVSGIRGAIKKAITTEGQDGVFRATFEDKILASDIVICKSWSTVTVLPYYVPVASLLYHQQQWTGMRTIRQIREHEQVAIPNKPNSHYAAQIIRPNKKFTPLHIPSKLQAALPFALKPKLQAQRASNHALYEHQRIVVRDPHEQQMYRLMQQVNTIKNVKEEKRKEQRQRQRSEWLKRKEKEEQKHSVQNKEVRKRKYVAEGQGRVVKPKRYTDK